MRILYGLAAAVLFFANPAYAETLTNASIVALVKSGVGDEVIIAVIERSDSKFDLSTTQILSLKKQGVSPDVIAAMLKAEGSARPAATPSARAEEPPPRSGETSVAPASLATIRSPGVYIAIGSKLIRIDASASSQIKTGGLLGSALTAGIVPASMKAVVSGESARTRTGDPNLTFYFYFGSGQDGSGWAAIGTPTSPNEFTLLRLTAKSGRREAKVGKMGITGMKSGVMDKDRLDFTYDEVRPGMFAVRPGAPLAPGEYAFIATIGSGGATSARIFDFAVQ